MKDQLRTVFYFLFDIKLKDILGKIAQALLQPWCFFAKFRPQLTNFAEKVVLLCMSICYTHKMLICYNLRRIFQPSDHFFMKLF